MQDMASKVRRKYTSDFKQGNNQYYNPNTIHNGNGNGGYQGRFRRQQNNQEERKIVNSFCKGNHLVVNCWKKNGYISFSLQIKVQQDKCCSR